MALVSYMVTLDAKTEATMPDKDWQDRVKGILKAELKRRNVSYRQLAEALGKLDVHETEANIKEGKISIHTPIAQGLLNKKVGDVVEIQVPRGTLRLRIENISIA